MRMDITQRFSLFKFVVGVMLMYFGLKILNLLPAEVTEFVETFIKGIMGNLWGLLLVVLGLLFLFRSVSTYRTYIDLRFNRRNNDE